MKITCKGRRCERQCGKVHVGVQSPMFNTVAKKIGLNPEELYFM